MFEWTWPRTACLFCAYTVLIDNVAVLSDAAIIKWSLRRGAAAVAYLRMPPYIRERACAP